MDAPHGQKVRGRESAQASVIPPMVYGITPQESLVDTNRESKRKESPLMEQTVIEREYRPE